MKISDIQPEVGMTYRYVFTAVTRTSGLPVLVTCVEKTDTYMKFFAGNPVSTTCTYPHRNFVADVMCVGTNPTALTVVWHAIQNGPDLTDVGNRARVVAQLRARRNEPHAFVRACPRKGNKDLKYESILRHDRVEYTWTVTDHALRHDDSMDLATEPYPCHSEAELLLAVLARTP